MVIINTTGDVNIVYTSRALNDTNIVYSLYNKGTRETIQATAAATYSDGEVAFTIDSLTFSREEGEQYYMTVVTDITGGLLFNANIFVTDQTDLQDYSISEGEYTTAPTSDNSFTTY